MTAIVFSAIPIELFEVISGNQQLAVSTGCWFEEG
jgi:hypothetical protein